MGKATAVVGRSIHGQFPKLPLEFTAVLGTLLLAVVAFMVVYPILLLLAQSLRVGQFGAETAWGIENWRAALTEPKMVNSLVNTLTLSGTRQVIGMMLGVILAWLLARTNLPWRQWLEFGFWVALLLPTLPVLLGWILLLDGHSGLLNRWLQTLPLIEKAPFEIFSWWGIVFMHLMLGTLPAKVFLLTPAFRNMDATLEEASRTAGASTVGTLIRIIVPLMTPTLLVVLLLGFIRSIQTFEIELILGTQIGIDVYSTLIYRQVMQEPPLYGNATALSAVVLAFLLPFIALQQRMSLQRSFVTVSGKYRGQLYDLGVLRWPIFAVIASMLVIMIILPTVFMFVGSFMKVFGLFEVAEPWTLRNWRLIATDPQLFTALRNTLYVALGSTALSVVLFSMIAYVAVRSRFAGRRLLDFLTWLPATVPGIVASLGMLLLFVGTPLFRPFYGTIFVLIIALGFSGITVGVQLIRAGLLQLGADLEEASWVAGGNWFYTVRRILIPLLAPVIAVVALQHFASASSAVSLIALLGSARNKPLSILQLEYIDTGLFEAASVVGVIIFLLTVGAALLARIYAVKVGLMRF